MEILSTDCYLSDDEVKRLRTTTHALAAADMQAGRVTWPRRWFVVNMALTTGLRRCELVKLTFGDLDADNNRLNVRRAKRRHRANDRLAVPDFLIDHIRDMRKFEGCIRDINDESQMFQGRQGPLTIYGIQKVWRAACEHVGLDYSIHAARHTCAMLLQRGGDLRLTQTHLGHSSPNITARYAHVEPERRIDAVSRMFGDTA